MGALDNTQHELVAQGLATGKTQAQAYVDAGYSPNSASANCCTLLARYPEIGKRRDELLERAAFRSELKAQDVQEMLMADRKLAHALGQPSAAIRAAELLGKQIGMFTERKEVKVGTLDELSPEQLDSITEAAIEESARRIAEESSTRQSRTEDPDLLSGDRPASSRPLP